MIKRDAHTYLDPAIYDKVDEKSKKEKKTISSACAELIETGLNYDLIYKELINIKKELGRANRRIDYLSALSEQQFANLNFKNQDVESSYNVQEFRKKYRNRNNKLIE